MLIDIAMSWVPALALTLVMPFVLAALAQRRGLNRALWAVIGLVPILNLLGLLVLAALRAEPTDRDR